MLFTLKLGGEAPKTGAVVKRGKVTRQNATVNESNQNSQPLTRRNELFQYRRLCLGLTQIARLNTIRSRVGTAHLRGRGSEECLCCLLLIVVSGVAAVAAVAVVAATVVAAVARRFSAKRFVRGIVGD